MSINNYVTMACDCCGSALKIDSQQYWETDDCARGEAIDEGWSCYNGGSDDQDFCPNCVAVKLVSLITMCPCETDEELIARVHDEIKAVIESKIFAMSEEPDTNATRRRIEKLSGIRITDAKVEGHKVSFTLKLDAARYGEVLNETT